jgi:Family of unknown function (DUF5681)
VSKRNGGGGQPPRTEDAPYKVGNKKPPLHTRFKPGQSGNPKGRSKGCSNFVATLLKEFHKPVSATINGKPIKVTNAQLFVSALVKDGIMKGPQSKALLLSVIQHSLAQQAAEAQTNKTQPLEEFSWTKEQELLYQEIEAAYAASQSSSNEES